MNRCWLFLFSVFIAGLFTSLSGASFAQEVTDDVRMAAGLRARGLFDLAETYCRNRLEHSELNPTEQTTLTLELMRSQSARALVTSGTERESAWQASDTTANEFLKQQANHPRKVLVQVQQALNFLAQGRLIQQELAAEMVPETVAEKALTHLRVANSQLNEIARQIDKAIPEQRTKNLTENDLSSDQLMTLKNNIRYQLAVCNLSRAKLFPADDQLNRIDALNQVTTRLDEVRRQSSPEQPIWWQTQVARLDTHRLLGEYGDAQRILLELPVEEADESMRQSILQQSIELSVATNDFSRSNQQFELADQFKSLEPETSLALLKMMLKLSEGSGGEKWLARAASKTTQIESDHGPYWGRRAELMLISKGGNAKPTMGSANGNGSSTEVNILTRVGDDAVRKDQLGDAIKAFEKALQAALVTGNGQQELMLSVKISRVLELQKEFVLASEKLTSAAEKHQSIEGSPQIHLRGCWNAAQAVSTEQDPAKKKPLQTSFAQALSKHLQFWPSSDTKNQALLWRGQYHHRNRQWEPAINDYLSIDSNSPFLVQAAANANTCLHRLNATNQNAQKPVAAIESISLQRLNQKIEETENVATHAKYELLITAADLSNRQTNPAARMLLQKLDEAINSCPPEYKNRLVARAAVAFANSSLIETDPDSTNERAAEFAQLLSTDPENLRQAAIGIKELSTRQPGSRERKILAEIREPLVRASEKLQLKDSERIFWIEESAQVLSELGRTNESISQLRELAKQKPKSASAQMALARALPDKEALSTWRRVAKKLKPKSDNWFEAKYNIAAILNRTGKTADALKLLEFMKIGSGWTKSNWKPKLDQLLIECQN